MGKWSQFSDEQKDSLLDSLEGLYDSPKVGHQVKELVEQHFGVTDPTLAMERRHNETTTALQARIDTLENEGRVKEISRRVDEEKKAAKEKYNLTDEDMQAVSKLMVEQGIGNYGSAADYYRLQKQAATPTPDLAGGHSALTLPDSPELFKDRNGWARKEAYKFINERGQHRV